MSDESEDERVSYVDMTRQVGEHIAAGMDSSFADDVEAARRWALIPPEDRAVVFELMGGAVVGLVTVLNAYGLQAEVVWRIKPTGVPMRMEPIDVSVRKL